MFDQKKTEAKRVSALMFHKRKRVCWPRVDGSVGDWSTQSEVRDEEGVLLALEYTPLSAAEQFYLKQLHPMFWGVLQTVKCQSGMFEFAQLYFDPRAKAGESVEFVPNKSSGPAGTVGV